MALNECDHSICSRPFTEMYGFPSRSTFSRLFSAPVTRPEPLAHASGHLWVTFLGGGSAMLTAVYRQRAYARGFMVMALGWKRVHGAKGGLVTDRVYRYVRHRNIQGIPCDHRASRPMATVTALMWPVLVMAYYRLAKKEEEMREFRTLTPFTGKRPYVLTASFF